MKRWSIRIAASLTALALLLFSAGSYLLGTESGTRFLLTQVEKQLNGALQLGASKGKLLDRIELTDILYDGAGGKVAVGRFILDWKSSDLFRLHLHILELTADEVSYSPAAAKEAPVEKADTPIMLPNLRLPLTISIENLGINSFVFLSAADEKLLTVDQAGLTLLWNKNGIRLQKLAITMPEATLAMAGQLNPVGKYPIQLTTDLEVLSPDLPSLKLLGEYGGDLQELHVKEVLSGDIRAEVEVKLFQLLNDLAWQGKLTIQQLRPALFSPAVGGVVNGALESSGTLQQADLNGSFRLHDETAIELNWDAEIDLKANLETLLVTINQLTLVHGNTTSRIDLSGSADPDGPLDLTLSWQALQWPLTGEAEYSSARGDATLTGTVDAYQLSLNTEAEGKTIPAIGLALTTDGNTEEVTDLQLKANLLGGVVGVQGTLQWTPAVSWDISTGAEHINPGIEYEQWPGDINWLIQSNGTIEEEGVVSEVLLEKIDGSLRQFPLSGSGRVHLQPEDIQIDGLRLSSGTAALSAQGSLGSASSLNWQLDVPDFSQILPESNGRLSANGTVSGEMATPALTLQLTASAINTPQLDLEQLQLKADLDLSWQQPFSVNLSGNELQFGENIIKDLRLQGQGKMEEHTVQLTATHELAALTLGLNGGYAEKQWQGMLDTFRIDSTDFGNWRLREASKISAGATAASLSVLCLDREKTALCLNGKWDTNNRDTSGVVEVDNFPLAWLSPWLPEAVESLDGLFSLQAAATMTEKLQADINAEITPGTITYLTDIDKEQILHQGMNLNLHTADDAVDGEFSLSVADNTISGTLHSPNLLKKDVGGKAALEGELLINAHQFDMVEVMFPAIQDLDAAIAMAFTVQGTVSSPKINGKGSIDIPTISIPMIGLDLSNTLISLTADNTDLTLNGKFTAPGGFMELDGSAILDSSQNWPARLTLKADNFRLINLPEINLFLTSDLLLEKKDGITSLSGSLTIPKADILLRELPPGSETVSADVIILQEQKEEEEAPSSPLSMDLSATLGKDVHFAGMGVNAFIDGQLTITAEPEEQLLGSGVIHIKQGSYRAYGQDLDIESGTISFPGGPLTQPGISLRATRTIGDIVAGISAIGPATKPRITTFSHPPMSEGMILSYLLTGSASNSAETGAKLSIGRQINNKLSVSVGADVKTGDSEFIARYRLNRRTHVQTTTATNSNAVDIFYTVELGGEEEAEQKVMEEL